VYEARQPRCPHCGALQIDSNRNYQEITIEKGAVTAPVLWQRPSESGPIEPLGASRVDPSRSYPVDDASLHLHELMDYCKSNSHFILIFF
jgi:hypothetical protein